MEKSQEEQMIQIGLSELFRKSICRYGGSVSDIYNNDDSPIEHYKMTRTIVKNPNFICKYFDDLDRYHKYTFMKACRIEGVNLYGASETWACRINEMLNMRSDQSPYVRGSSCSPCVQSYLDEYKSLTERESPLLMAALLL